MSAVVDHPDTSVVDLGVNRAGLTQLRRRWIPADPWAAALIVHGLGEHSGRYLHVGAGLAAAGIATVAYDQQGYGQSGGVRNHIGNWTDFADDVEDHLAELATLAVPTVLMGHSMGGLVALGYVLADRPPPDRLVLSAPALGSDTPNWMRRGARPLGALAPRARIPSTFESTTLSRDVRVQEAYDTDPLVERTPSARLGAELFAAMDWTNRNLHRLNVPTYVLHGGEDTLVPTASSEVLGTLPGVTRVVHRDLRHECLNEPEGAEVLADVIAWLRSELRG